MFQEGARRKYLDLSVTRLRKIPTFARYQCRVARRRSPEIDLVVRVSETQHDASWFRKNGQPLYICDVGPQNSAATCVTQGTETIDSFCFAFCSSSRGYTEIVLDANSDLALQPAILPAGLRITLPEPARVRARQPTIRLWD